MSKFIFLGISIILASIFTAGAQSNTRIIVKTDDKMAASVTLEPFTNIPLYTYSSAKFTSDGQAVLQLETDLSMMVELKVREEGGRPLQRVPLYLEPGTELTVTLIKGKSKFQYAIDFQGQLSRENRDLKKINSSISLLESQTANLSELQEQIAKLLDGKTYSSGFKEHIQTVVSLSVQEKKLASLENKPKAYRKSLQGLLQALKKENSWQSIFQWTYTLNNIFSRCEAAGLVKTSEDGFVNRLEYIGNEDIKSKYGIFHLNMLVNSRCWFENPPKDAITAITPYITTAETKQDLEAILKNMERIEQSWAHLRTQPAPDFTFEDVNGKMVTLSDFRGKFVLLDVWNIYCGPCMRQVPHLQKLEPELQKMGVEVIGVSCDPQNIKDKWKATVEAKKMAGIQTIMDKGRQSKFMKDYAIPGFPTFCLINPEGYVINPYFRLYPETPGFMEYMQQKINEYSKQK